MAGDEKSYYTSTEIKSERASEGSREKKYEFPNNGAKTWRCKRVPKSTSVIHQKAEVEGYTWISYYIVFRIGWTQLRCVFSVHNNVWNNSHFHAEETMVNMEIKGKPQNEIICSLCAVLCCINSLFLIMLWLDDIAWKIIIIIRPKYNVDFMKRFYLSIRSFTQPLFSHSPPGFPLIWGFPFCHCRCVFSTRSTHKMEYINTQTFHWEYNSFLLTRSQQTTNIKSITCNIIQITTTRPAKAAPVVCMLICLLYQFALSPGPKINTKKKASICTVYQFQMEWKRMIKAQK